MRVQGEWQVQEAKNRLSELLMRVERDGPQRITRRGEHVAVVLSETDFERLSGADAESDGLVSFLLSAPLRGLDLPDRRGDDRPRDPVDL